MYLWDVEGHIRNVFENACVETSSKNGLGFSTLVNSLNTEKHGEYLLFDYHIYYYIKWNGLSRSKLTKMELFIQ